MGKYTKDDLIQQAETLAKMIAETETVQQFKEAEAALQLHERVRGLMKEMKAEQKQAVNFEHYGKTEALQQSEAKLAALQAELDSIPVVQQFMAVQEELNDVLQLVTTTIGNTVTDEILRTTGGDVLQGKTGAQKAVESLSCGDGCGCY
ncbi:MAG: RicAFT regulatory complex protein RicA family protein [Bacilli bacterium]